MVKEYKIPHEKLIKLLESLKSLMVSVSTGGPDIQKVNNDEYQSNFKETSEGLRERGLENPIPFNDLWGWKGKWSDHSLPTYKSRRNFLGQMFNPLIERVKGGESVSVNPVFEEPTGWSRVDRSMDEIKLQLMKASTEEQFQGIGNLARETLISLAQEVYDSEQHPILDGKKAGKTDVKQMLDAYIAVELKGRPNENIRKYAKVSLDMANDLTHRRTAEFRLAALCAEATNAVINIISIISGRRDRK